MHRSLTHVSALTALCSGATLLAALGVTRAALADEACGDVTCPKGFECEITTLGCPLIACAEGDECEPCVPEEIGTCVPVPCTSDESCGPHMVCAEQDRVSCSAVSKPACAEGEECIEPDIEPECETTTVSQCVPQWELPCTSAADCGEGFTCEPIMQCACSGSYHLLCEID